MRYSALLWACAPLFLGSALTAQFIEPLAKGSHVTSDENLYVYSVPPNSYFKNSSAPAAILGFDQGGTQYFPLEQTDNGLLVGTPVPLSPSGLVITDDINVLRKGQTQRWVALGDPNTPNAAELGWMPCPTAQDGCGALIASPQNGGITE